MRLTLVLLAARCLQTLALPRAAAQDQIELFGGYSFAHASFPLTTTFVCPSMMCPLTTSSTFHPNLNGWEFAGTYKPGSWSGRYEPDARGSVEKNSVSLNERPTQSSWPAFLAGQSAD
jgi:hypothetical protein